MKLTMTMVGTFTKSCFFFLSLFMFYAYTYEFSPSWLDLLGLVFRSCIYLCFDCIPLILRSTFYDMLLRQNLRAEYCTRHPVRLRLVRVVSRVLPSLITPEEVSTTHTQPLPNSGALLCPPCPPLQSSQLPRVRPPLESAERCPISPSPSYL